MKRKISRLLIAIIIALSIFTVALTNAADQPTNGTDQPTKTPDTWLTPLKNCLGDLSSVILSAAIILITLLIVISIVLLILWISRQDKGLAILPFEVFTDQQSQRGRAISDSLIFELQRISQIHQNARDLETVQSEKLPLTLPIKAESLKELSIEPETLDASIADVGTLGIGGITVSLGGLMIFLKRIWVLGNPGRIITGSLQKYGSVERLVARMQDRKIYVWEASTTSTNDEQIPDLIRDIAFKISRDLSKNISAKDWESFKYFTEALNYFQHYQKTRKLEALESAKENCIQAFNLESDYLLLFGIVCNLGIAYLDTADYVKAGQMFDCALRLQPDNRFAIAGKAAVESRLGWHDEALNDINYAIDNAVPTQENQAQAYAQRGNTYSQLGEADRLGLPSTVNPEMNRKALADFTMALEQLPLNEQNMRVFILSRRGAIYSRLGDYKKALKDLDEAIALKRDYAWAIASRGVTRLLIGKEEYKQVINDLNYSLRLNPGLSWAYANRGEAYRQLEDYDKAITDFDQAIKIDPRYELAIAGRGLTYFLTGNYDNARNDFDQCLKLNPKLDWVLAKRGLVYAYLKDFDRAIDDISHSINLAPCRDWFRYNRALIYRASNQLDRAQNDLAEAIRLAQCKWNDNPQNWRNTYNLAIYQLAAGNPKLAESLYKDAVTQKAPPHFTRIAICDLRSFLMLFPDHVEAQEIIQWLESEVPKLADQLFHRA